MEECLKDKSLSEIVNATEKGFSFVPVIDGKFLSGVVCMNLYEHLFKLSSFY